MNLAFVADRTNRILMDLKHASFADPFSVCPVEFSSGHYDTPEQADAQAHFHDFSENGRWGERNGYCWFRANVSLPRLYYGKQLVLSVTTEDSLLPDTALLSTFVQKSVSRWDLMNPQFLFFVNGKLVQGLDTNHLDVPLDGLCDAGGPFRLDFQGYAGMTDKRFGFHAAVSICRENVRQLYYDLQTALESAECLDKNSPERFHILQVLNDALNLLDMRNPRSNEFDVSVTRAAEYLQSRLYGSCTRGSAKISCVGHTHIDVTWLWDLAQVRVKILRSFSTVLNLMRRYPDYTFLQSQPQLYQFVKEDAPELYAEIKEAVRQGRWEPEGVMWLEPDCNIPSGESLVRQIQHGKRFFQKEFGVESKILWLPDVFGYSAALPQILKKSGAEIFVTTKISWNKTNKMPYDTFLWQGIDSTEILSYFITTTQPGQKTDDFTTTYSGVITPEVILGSWDRYQQKDINQNVLIAYGYGDGGGGPTPEMLEKLKRLEQGLPGMPEVRSDHAGDFFNRLKENVQYSRYLPRWVGELYLELHQGSYTSMSEIKKNNRKTENLLRDAEIFQTYAMLFGAEYEAKLLYQNWEILLLNQGHDILAGTCIKEVYDESRKQFAGIRKQVSGSIDRALSVICSKIDAAEAGVALFNTLTGPRDDIVQVDVPDGISNPVFYDSGKVVPCELLANGKALLFVKSVPAFGWKTLSIMNAIPPTESVPVASDASDRLENRYFSLCFDSNGNICRLYDKINERDVLMPGAIGNQLVAFDDRPACWDTWNIDPYFEEKSWAVNDLHEFQRLPDSAVRRGIKICRKWQNSEITQYIYVYEDIPRIDFQTEIDWHEDSIVLKTAFPVNINNDFATYDIQFGSIKRPTHFNTSWDAAKYEVCAHQWADLSETDYGVSLLNDCKYGYDIHNGVMRLTLLKSGMAPYDKIDRGLHSFTYSIFPHAGGFAEGGTAGMANRLNVPMRSVSLKKQTGCLKSDSLISVNRENVIIDTVKKAEDGDGIIVRVFESANSRVRATVSFHENLREVFECDLMEHEISRLEHEKREFTFEIKPYEIKTFKIDIA